MHAFLNGLEFTVYTSLHVSAIRASLVSRGDDAEAEDSTRRDALSRMSVVVQFGVRARSSRPRPFFTLLRNK